LNGNGEIQPLDLDGAWNIQAGDEGYLQSDFNMDAQSNNRDKDEYWLPNLGKGTSVPN
jgi:hypothetical protein